MAKLKPFDPLEPVRRDPASVTSFVLNPAALRNMGFESPPVRSFPRELLACKNLVRLELFRGIAQDGDGTIPAEIGTLSKLEHLSLGGLTFTALPDAIGDLKELRVLSLVYNESLRELPRTVGGLASLEELALGYTALRELPREVGKLKKLKKLSVANITEVPAELFDLANLEELALPDSVKRLPPGLGRLKRLDSLSISASALTGAAAELPQLTRLRTLWVSGKATHVPATLGELRALEKLSLSYLGLTSLPETLSALVNLVELSVAGNALTDILALVCALPKLAELSFSGNPLIHGQKKTIEALMGQSPSKRKLSSATPARDAKKEKAAAMTPKPERLGDVTSVNASLLMLVADAPVAAGYMGITNPDDPRDSNVAGSDCDRLVDALRKGKRGAPFEVRGKPALALTLSGRQGQISVWSVGDRLVLFEGAFETDEEELEDEDAALFHAFIAGEPTTTAKEAGALAVKSGQLVMMPWTDACPDVAKLLAKKRARRAIACGAEKSGLMVAVKSGTHAFLVEPEVEAAWGSGVRCHVLPR